MNAMWQKWAYYNLDMLIRHIGTAGVVWGGISLKQGTINWSELWVALLSGAILPTIFTILQRGLPKFYPDQTDENENPPTAGPVSKP